MYSSMIYTVNPILRTIKIRLEKYIHNKARLFQGEITERNALRYKISLQPKSRIAAL